MEILNAFQLSAIAGTLTPDTTSSYGARFLLSVQSSLVERLHYNAVDDYQDLGDVISEVADGSVPSWNSYRMWVVFAELGAWREDIREMGGSASEDMTKNALVALYMIAERLCMGLCADLAEELTR